MVAPFYEVDLNILFTLWFMDSVAYYTEGWAVALVCAATQNSQGSSQALAPGSSSTSRKEVAPSEYLQDGQAVYTWRQETRRSEEVSVKIAQQHPRGRAFQYMFQ